MSGFSGERTRVTWTVVALACAAVLGFVLWRYVGTFVLGLFLYYAVRPIHRRIRRAVPSANLAAFVAMFLFVLPLLLVTWYAIAVVIQEAARLLRDYPVNNLSSLLDRYVAPTRGVFDPETIISGGAEVDIVVNSFDVFVTSLSVVGVGLVHVFVMLAFTFYLLRDGRRLARWLDSYVNDECARRFFRAVDRDLQMVYFGNIANAALTAVIAVLAYESLNAFSPPGTAIPYPAVVGVLTGAASLVPVIGIKLVWVPIAVYVGGLDVLAGRPENLWFVLVFSGVSLVFVDVIPDVVLRPFVSGRSLHTGALMVTYIIGGLLFGWYGIFLAPLLLVVITEFSRIVLPELVAGEPAPPKAETGLFAGHVPPPQTESTGDGPEVPSPDSDHSDAADESATGRTGARPQPGEQVEERRGDEEPRGA